MTPSQYQRLVPLFDEAMKLPLTQRPQFAQKLCANDPQLLKDLLQLLHNAQQPIDSLDIPLAPSPSKPPSPNIHHLNFEHFQVVRSLGHGGMGSVYQAIDRRTGATVALKLIQSRGAFSQEQRLRFLVEARGMSALRHPNIVEIFDIGQTQGHLYLLMEYLEGRSLQAVLAQSPLLDLTIIRIVSQIASALAFAHSRGIVHGDVKPHNIMVLKTGVAKLIDFGVAQFGDLSAALGFGGTLPYLSPERFHSPAPTPASDVWALGVTLLECLTGKLPFADSAQVCSLAHPQIPSASPLASALNSLLSRILDKNLSTRLQTAEEFASALDRLLWAGNPSHPSQVPPPKTDTATYELPDLALTPSSGTVIHTSLGVFLWRQEQRAALLRAAGQDVVLDLGGVLILPIGFALWLFVSLFLSHGAAGLFLALLVLCTLIFALFFLRRVVTAAVRPLLAAFEQIQPCRVCRFAMKRASTWTRLVNQKEEVVHGQNDCKAALQHGLWPEAAKLLTIHGKESVSTYSNFIVAPGRFCLDFFECENCGDQAARLTFEDRDEDRWLQQARFFLAYKTVSERRSSLFRYVKSAITHVPRILSGVRLLHVHLRPLLIVVAAALLFAVVSLYSSYASARNERAAMRSLVAQQRICYGYDAEHYGIQPTPFSPIFLANEAEIDQFTQKYLCKTNLTGSHPNCDSYCVAK